MTRANKESASRAACLFSGAVVCFAAFTVFGRLNTEIHGMIIESRPGSSVRRSTWYKVRQADGSFQTFVAGSTDASLPRDLSPGTSIEKERWHLGYAIDHHYHLGFPIYVYGGLAAVSSIFFSVGLFQLHSREKV